MFWIASELTLLTMTSERRPELERFLPGHVTGKLCSQLQQWPQAAPSGTLVANLGVDRGCAGIVADRQRYRHRVRGSG
jgi:hypothetical protein